MLPLDAQGRGQLARERQAQRRRAFDPKSALEVLSSSKPQAGFARVLGSFLAGRRVPRSAALLGAVIVVMFALRFQSDALPAVSGRDRIAARNDLLCR
jgi:hypothetical protein